VTEYNELGVRPTKAYPTLGDGGALKVYRADGTNLYINPSAWLTIEEMPPPTSR
jgi:hypothetical protein